MKMGSERLGHMFTVKDPTFKEQSSSKNHSKDSSSTHHALSHSSGTQPVSISNGPRSSPTSSSITKVAKKLKPNSKYRKLWKLQSRQISFIGTTLDAIESLSNGMSDAERKDFSLKKDRFNALNERIENVRHSAANQDHQVFDQIKSDIQHLIDDLKSFKTTHHHSNAKSTLDMLFGIPLEASETDENDEDEDPNKVLNYF